MQFHKKKQNENKHLLKLFFIAREKNGYIVSACKF